MQRKWCVLLAVHGYSLEVSVWADDALLMPIERCEPPSQIITRLISVLVDYRDGDSITAVVHGAGPLWTWSGSNQHLALHWIATALMTAWWPSGSYPVERDDGSFHTPPSTGVRQKVNPIDHTLNTEPAAARSSESSIQRKVAG